MRKLLSICIAALLLAALAAPARADSAALGETVDAWSADLTSGAVLSGEIFWTGSDLRTEYLLTLAPGSLAVPVAVSADVLSDRRPLDEAAAELERRGLHVLGGTNGGYYTVATGEPCGAVISGGRLLHDDEGLYAMGFRADGSAVFGVPGVRVALACGDSEYAVAGFNRVAAEGLSLITAGAYGTVTPAEHSACAVLSLPEIPAFGEAAETRVEEIFESDGSALTVEEGSALLLLPPAVEDEPAVFPEKIAEEAALELRIRCGGDWEDVDSAVGIVYPLLVDGETAPKLTATAAPRTAVGLRADGTLLLYVIDGRQSGYSVGCSLQQLAERMRELGCVSAGALDGGGSSQLSAFLPGEAALRTFNSPSETPTRKVVNYILLAAPTQPVGAAEQLTMEPLHINAVAGAEIPLTVRASDRYGYGAEVPAELTFTVTEGLGTVTDGVYYADGTGSGTITVSAPGAADGVIPVRVTGSPDTLELYGEKYGKKTESLTLDPGQEVDLTVRAFDRHIPLSTNDRCYAWALDAEAGTVDETGHLVPGEISVTGTLTVTAGESSVAIPITVDTGIPFRDVKYSDPYFAAVKYVYDHGIFNGTSATTFDPDTVMSRGMLVTVLWRMEGRPEASAPAAFADVEPGEWYADAVAWAAECGIVNGYSAEAFGPKDDLTREQILTILHRWAGEPEPPQDVPQLPEDADVSDWALSALRWAYATAVVADAETAEGAAHDAMPRAAVAEVLRRYDVLPKEE